MRRNVRALTGAALAGVLLVSGLTGAPARAAVSAPSAPSSLATYQGVDGVTVAWLPPRGSAPVAGYEIQRAGSAGEYSTVGTAGSDDRRYVDVTAVASQTYRYRVVATNDTGASPPSATRTVRVPAPPTPGSTTRFVIVGAPGSPWEGGLGFAGSEVTMTRLNDREYKVRGVSTADSAQGAQDVSFVLGSTAGGTRIDPSSGRQFSTVGPDQPNALVPSLYPITGATCARPGTLTTRGTFTADGTPLVVGADFEYCGTRGYLAWNSASDVGTALRTSPTRVDYQPGTTETRTVTFENLGGGPALTLGPSRLDDYAGGTPTSYTIASDTCSGVALAGGATCQISVAADPPAGGAAPARLVLAVGNFASYEVALGDGPDVPAPPTVVYSSPGSWGGARVGWTSGMSSPPVTGYSIYRGTSEAGMTRIADVPTTAGGLYIDRSAGPDANYVYQVTATNSVGESRRSNGNYARTERVGTVAATTLWSDDADRDIAVLGPDGIPVRLTADPADETDPVIVPDGSTLIYASTKGNGPGDYDLWVHPIAGSARRLTQDSSSADGTPSLSRDGKTVAFTRTSATGTTSVWTVPFGGGTAAQVPNSVGDSNPEWAPSGRVLAVSHTEGATTSIVVTSLSGGFRRTVPGTDQTNVSAGHPVWSGTNIAYVRADAGTSQVVIASPFDGYASNLSSGEVSARALSGGPGLVLEGTAPGQAFSLWRSGPFPVAGSDFGVFEAPYAAGPLAPYTPQTIVPPKITSTAIGSGTATVRWQHFSYSGGPNCIVCGVWTIVRRGLPNDYNTQLTKPTDGIAVYAGDATSATLTGLSDGKQHSIALFALSIVGDISPAVTTGATPSAPPVVAPSGTSLSALSGNGPAFVAKWGPTAGIGQAYEVQIASRPLSAVTTTAAAPAFAAFYTGEAGSKVVKAKPATVYYLRARLKDNYYNPTAWSAVSTVTVPYDDRAFKTSGTWAGLTNRKGNFAGTLREARGSGASLTGTVYGSTLALIVNACPTCGKIKIFVDGKRVATVDTYAKKETPRRQVWSVKVRPGAHMIKLVAAGSASRPTTRVDAFVARP